MLKLDSCLPIQMPWRTHPTVRYVLFFGTSHSSFILVRTYNLIVCSKVCSGTTGHVEVLWVELNDPSTNFEPLIRFFFQFHDPTTKDRQGNDTGSQYGSAIFCEDDAQKTIAQNVKAEVQQLLDAGKINYAKKQVETMIVDMNPFYPAHEEHQQYLEKNPSGYCNHYYRFKEWPTALN